MPIPNSHLGLFYTMKPLKIPVVAAHAAGWILFQCLPVVFIMSFARNTNLGELILSYQYLLFCLYFIVLFYLHCYVLLPRLLGNGKWILYVASLLVLLASAIYLEPFEQLMRRPRPDSFEQRRPFPAENARDTPFPFPPEERLRMERNGPPGEQMGQKSDRGGMRNPGKRGPAVDIISVFLFIITLCLSAAIDIARRWRITEQRLARAEADKANAELSFLKAQINPHFLFNTLNNIYSMVMMGHEHTGESVLKLSNILRYVTEESKEDYVSLQSEIDCISDYIDLQRLRLGKKVSLEYAVTGNLENRKIAPMVLMTFIENVFKYGISSHEETSLIIRISVTGNIIHFYSQNKLSGVPRQEERTGIGINNTQKRLAHLYPGRYELVITRDNGLFTVDLTIQD